MKVASRIDLSPGAVMTTLVASAERTIAAPADTLYSYVADFRVHHPRILPPAFSDFTVEAGGIGVGTVTSSTFRMGGQTQTIRTRVLRVEPGRLIEESVLDRPMTTTFSFTPNGGRSAVRIETAWQPNGGIRGVLERIFAPRQLARVYADELGRLEAYALSRQ
jgi:uncharacterized protein YndB with AHSA1/START domain